MDRGFGVYATPCLLFYFIDLHDTLCHVSTYVDVNEGEQEV